MIKLRSILVFLATAVVGLVWTLAPYQNEAAAQQIVEETADQIVKEVVISENLNCYGFFRGSSEGSFVLGMPFVVNPSGGEVSAEELLAVANAAVTEWEVYTGDVFGDGSVDETATFVHGDGINTITFGEPLAGAIATNFRFDSGLISENWKISEWDIVLDVSFSWGDEFQEEGVLDLQGVLTHELGHSLGLTDLSNNFCEGQTMYQSGEFGKLRDLRSLGERDIEGLRVLYPNN